MVNIAEFIGYELSPEDFDNVTFESIKLSPDQRVIEFTSKGRTVMAFLAEGYCCSDTWIDRIDSIDRPDLSFNNGTIIGIKTLPLPKHYTTEVPNFISSENKEETIEWYGYQLTIKDDRGYSQVQIEFRNAGRGYGGYLGKITPSELNEYYNAF